MQEKVIAGMCLVSMLAGCLTGCGRSLNKGQNTGYFPSEAVYEEVDIAAEEYDGGYENGVDFNTEEYNAIEETGFQSVASSPLSTFSADVDTASYSNLRRMIMDGYTLEDIPQGAVRIEEMLNYFSYDYELPKEGEPFGVTTRIADCQWNPDSKLMQIGLQTEALDFSEAPDSNLVFLIDVSGSMDSEDKIGLLKRAFSMLAEELTEKDRVSIVTYAGSDEIVLEGVCGNETERIREALDNLFASGSTNGGEAILSAYELAEENYIKGGNNRIILATDGDLNVGITSESSLKRLVEKKRKNGVYLSVLGFGTGNIKDNKMETLADCGNGNYSYIDSMSEAKKVLVEEMGANFVTVAKDVKFQVEFNPAVVKGYRLIGYDNRRMENEDFEDDTKDAGEVGAGHSVTVLYEIVTADSEMELNEPEFKYSGNRKSQEEEETGDAVMKEREKDTDCEKEWLTVSVRYKEPDGDESRLLTYPVGETSCYEEMTEDFRFAAAVAEFGMIVRDSQYKGDSSFESVLELLEDVNLKEDEYKEEFYYLVKKLKRAA